MEERSGLEGTIYKPIEDKEITISKDFDSTYKTRYEDIYKVTCPVFEFSYPSSRWKVTDEEVGNAQDDLIAEKVTISNDRGVEITYWDTNKALGTHAHILQVIKITKVADSSFVPSYPAGTDMDCSSLGNFMVAKLHVIKEMDGAILSSRTLTAFYRQTGSRNGKREQSADKG